jgi:hypothetical protein
MLLTIDKAKVDNLLRGEQTQYVVTASHLMISAAPAVKPPSTAIYGSCFPTNDSAIEGEKYFQALRQKVLASGIRLSTPEEIEGEIHEMRRTST